LLRRVRFAEPALRTNFAEPYEFGTRVTYEFAERTLRTNWCT
jgi:hypothetical protein